MFQALSSPSSDEIVAVTQQIVKLLNISVTNSTIERLVKENPNYPNIAAVKAVMGELHINCIVAQVNKESLNEIPVPFIAHTPSTRHNFMVVTAISDNMIFYIKNDSFKSQLDKSKEKFLKEWSGVVLLAEATEKSGAKEDRFVQKKEITEQVKVHFIIAGLIFIAILSSFTHSPFNTIGFILLLLKLTGCTITSMLLWYEIDNSNSFLQKICGLSKQTSCNAVLASKQAKIIAWLSWSELGFFYFTGGLLLLSLVGGNLSVLYILALLNMLAIPFTVFSVYYQWRVIKQWCPLCMAVQILLLAEFFTSLITNSVTYIRMDFYFLMQSFVIYTIPVLLWWLLKPLLVKVTEATQYRYSFYRLKNDPGIFELLLKKQKQISILKKDLGIILGNPSATNTIVKVCNPYCGPCSKAHIIIDRMLEENDNLKVQIIFTVTTEEKDYRNKPVKHLLALDEKGDKTIIKKGLNDWYSMKEKNYELFASKYPLNGQLIKQNNKVKAMAEWCKDKEIEFTPTFFVNGFQLPKEFSLNDVSYLLV
ncbi:MAG: thioredoxin domain-containing protein [Sphingobacteriales bacterium]|nr:thioredoxin domain-containing protein [Sphingobacteriales bacterium]